MPAAAQSPPVRERSDEAPRVLSTLNDDGSRRWIRPRLARGAFLTRRRAVAYALILVFTLIPYLRMNGKPLVLLDLVARRFTLFGYTFFPTDTLLLALLLVSVFLTIFLLTALFGRVWCGWACPQTVYMEFVFRPIERLFDGAPGRAKGPLAGRGFSPLAKYAAFLVVSLFLAHTFLAYFVGVEQLRHWMLRSPLEHPGAFLVMAAVTGLMMFDFSFFREQMCIVACPYGRFQSALLDRDSLIVSYDARRGEPRGKAKRDVALAVLQPDSADARQGDCVDCRLCVQACPTGIDIRDGLQMECIGCTQCIDACDAVMTKLHRPRGLVRYSSQSLISGQNRRFLRPRVVIYPLALLAVVTAFIIVLATKDVADVTILRGVGRPFVELPHDRIGNPIRVKIVNRTDDVAVFEVATPGQDDAELTLDENPIRIPPGAARVVSGMLSLDEDAFTGDSRDVTLTVSATAPAFRKNLNFRLIGPAHHARRDHKPSHSETDP